MKISVLTPSYNDGISITKTLNSFKKSNLYRLGIYNNR